MTTQQPPIDAAAVPDPLGAAVALVPRLRELAGDIERERQLPAKLVDEMRAAGFFHLLLPRALGGSETDPVTAARVVEEIAYGDASAGWCVMLAHQSVLFAGFLPAEQVHEIWGNGGIVAGTARPIGRAVPTETPAEGFVVSGRWPFASGSSHADWFMGECIVYEGEQPRQDAQGNNVTRAVFVPRSEVTIHDTWHTTGLRGTASNDFGIEGAFVPASRAFQVLVDPPLHESPLFRALMLVFANHGSHALGVARAAVDAARELVSAKRGWGDVPLREVPRVQAAIAEATALVESARAYLYAALDELWAVVQAGGDGSPVQRGRVRLAASHAAAASVRAVDLVHGVLATSAIFAASSLERQFRDMHTAAAHVMIGPLTYEAAGRVELGLMPDFPFF